MPVLIRISRISVIAPMLNEAPYVAQLATDLRRRRRVVRRSGVIVDGAAERLGLTLKVLDNPVGSRKA
jgi:hypothetical protein